MNNNRMTELTEKLRMLRFDYEMSSSLEFTILDIAMELEECIEALETTCRNVHEEWEKTSFAGAETSFCCSECGAHYVDAESYYAGLADANDISIQTNYCPNCGARVIDNG